ncbi:MAG TPA: hypothetical protein VIF88_08200 [Methylocystis sp.]|jgi:hypothetical protein
MEDRYLKGALDERRRIAAIVKSAEAHGRAELALHLALSSNMSAEQARRALDAAPIGQSQFEVDYEAGAAEARRILGK